MMMTVKNELFGQFHYNLDSYVQDKLPECDDWKRLSCRRVHDVCFFFLEARCGENMKAIEWICKVGSFKPSLSEFEQINLMDTVIRPDDK